ncbi:aspartyl-phosphate phosphatase Spo0E family protein [Paenibacillus sp. FSL P2-0536]|uniref:aspartyl-phosphate phosphatase Spo0E family protein n=1 Tax=Paenibacillus sp. FSL P2-0536 TaxID=2921629 RepID=UPI0030F58F60
MSEKKAYLPIRKERIDQLVAEMEMARNELNQMAGDLRTLSDDVLELSNKLDVLVNKFMKLSTLYKAQNRTK